MTTEILCAAGVEWLIRIGSCGSLQDHVKIGDLVIVTGAIRGEGTTSYYVPRNFSTVAHSEIVNALKQAAETLKIRYHLGWIFTTDALFQETPELIEELNQQQVSSIDMVTSTFLTVAQLRKKKAGAILAVSDECLHGKFGFRDPLFLAAEEKMVQVAENALRYL
jgi:uridine phosphorylase